MRIPINKEIEEAYKDQFMKGFSIRETGYIALAIGIIFGIGTLVWFIFGLPINICAYIGMPFGFTVLFIGFKKFQGLTLIEYIKEILYENKIKILTYDADEIPIESDVYNMEKRKNTAKKRWRLNK